MREATRHDLSRVLQGRESGPELRSLPRREKDARGLLSEMKERCIQCGGAISKYTASSATSPSTVASAPVVLVESDDEPTTMEPAVAKKAKTAAEVAVDAIKQLQEQLMAAERLQKGLAAREAAARIEAQVSNKGRRRRAPVSFDENAKPLGRERARVARVNQPRAKPGRAA